VLLVSPLLLLALGYGLVYASFRYAGLARPSHLEVVGSFWEEAEVVPPVPGEPPASEQGRPTSQA